MSAALPIAVVKFGGTSVATPEQRGLAIDRVRQERAEGFAVVVVVSAMGRPPEPYATDTLLSHVGGLSGTINADILLACGELIAAAIFAEELTVAGIAARALSGAQAGIITNEMHGDATITRVEPHQVRALLEADVVPVIAGFQGAMGDGTITTLGRGGTDLTAIAMGDALGAERVDIYTDVSGAMTADPRRIEGARTIERASLEEMSELAQNGAKVMHHKAASYAQARGTSYAIKGLATGTGTIVDTSAKHAAPVTGVTSIDNLTWVRAIRGDIENPTKRMETELEMFRRLAAAEISIDQVTINQSGVAFVVQGERGTDVRRLLGDLNIAVRVREGCSKISIVGAGMRGTPGVVYEIVKALSQANVEIIHATDSNITISVLVPESDVARAEAAVHEHFQLASGD
ncbi:MAG TPA: aspartate kinase [Candidatus Baltobacteraceae bacterium]|nr:aspartate kinase [Candidatus Baltobacteraceae bacterium]